MAEVYLARQEGQPRLVAVKRILPNIAADDEFIAMFIDEAKIAGQLNHPNVAQIFDLGKIGNTYFIAMEYVSGHDLRALWDRTRDAGERGENVLPVALACYVVRRICDGLDYAHRRRDAKGRPLGIIHRDVSPQNILVSYDGDLKIIDFGIAKAANRMVRTQTGILKGKFAYMAPEQARGEPIDHRADIFAIGVILYELLTGERAFKADSDFVLLEKVRRVELPAPRSLRPELPKELERIVFKALAKEAADRYAWASALGADLESFMSAQGYDSSKEELGGFLRRTFEEELRDEERRLAAYQALFDDVEERRAPAARRPQGSGGDSLADEDEVVTLFESGPDASASASAAGETELPRLTSGSAVPSRGSSVGLSGRSEVRRLGGSSSAAPSDDQTQLDPAAPPPMPAQPAAPPEVVARDEMPRKLRVVPSAGLSPSQPKNAARPGADPAVGPDVTWLPAQTERMTNRGLRIHQKNSERQARLAATAPALVAAILGAGIVGVAWLAAGTSAPTVLFVTTPRQADVRRSSSAGDEVLCVQTPCAVALPVGKHEIRFRAPGAEELSRLVEVKGDGTATPVDVVLERARDDVRLETSPPGASVTLDDRPLAGTTPLTLPKLLVGSVVRIKLLKDGFGPLEINRVTDDDAVWRYDLPTATTTWTVSADPPDALFDGPGRIVPVFGGNKLVVSVGKKSMPVALSRPGCVGRSVMLYATGRTEAEQRVELECKKLDAGLFIRGKRGLRVRIDGTDIPKGASLEPYQLPAGTWTVSLRGSRGKTETSSVELRAGENLTLTSKLK
jgi:serine/threonine protein kinase